MGKSNGSGKQRVVDYRMSLHFGLCLGSADELKELWFQEKLGWSGSITSESDTFVSNPELFGGPKDGGGPQGYVRFMPGGKSQKLPARLAGLLGLTPDTAPGYRGFTSLWFFGASDGFLWQSNNPYLPSVWAKIKRIPKVLDTNKAEIEGDANPAHIIYECLTSTEFGMGAGATEVDTASFQSCADTLYAEKFGLSLMWTRQTEIEKFVQEICDHVQAFVYLSPRTGKWTMKLVRNDWGSTPLQEVNKDNARVTKFSRKAFGEIANEITVTWTDPNGEQEQTITRQDIAAVASQGSVITSSRNYYGIRKAELAERVCLRDLRTSVAPLATVEAELNRAFWGIAPGDVLTVNWPEYLATPMVMRVMRVSYGTPGESKIRVSLMEDVFSLAMPTATGTAPGQWVEPGQAPEQMLASQGFTLPYYVLATNGTVTPSSVSYPQAYAGVLAYHPMLDAQNYELFVRSTDTTGATTYTDVGTYPLSMRAQLLSPLPTASSSVAQVSAFVGNGLTPNPGDLMLIGNGPDGQNEIALVTSTAGGALTLNRGCLDTVPKSWPVNTPVWFFNPTQGVFDLATARTAGSTATYRQCLRTSKGVIATNAVADVPVALNDRFFRPNRPAYCAINGSITPTYNASGQSQLVLSWAIRNRTMEAGQVLTWTSGSVTPEQNQQTIIRVYDPSGTKIIEYSGFLWNDSSYTLQKSWFDKWSSVTIEFLSERDGFESFQSYKITVTGLAGSGTGGPPAPPSYQEPPPAAGAPGAVAFKAVATQTVTGTQESPVKSVGINVSGKRDNIFASGLIVRYKILGDPAWTTMPETGFNNDGSISLDVTSLAGLTQYLVQIAYRVPTGVGAFRQLNAVLTGEATSSSSGEIQGLKQDVSSIKTSVTNLNQTQGTQGGQISALSGQITTVSQNLTSTNNNLNTLSGTVSTLSTAQTGLDGRVSATETKITQAQTDITSTKGDVTTLSASVTAISSAQTSLAGKVNATYSLTLQANGYVTGWRFNNDGTTGNLTILADKFSIVNPSVGAGTVYTPFSVTANGVNVNTKLTVGSAGQIVIDPDNNRIVVSD